MHGDFVPGPFCLPLQTKPPPSPPFTVSWDPILYGYSHQLPCPMASIGVSQWGAPKEEKEDSEDYLCPSRWTLSFLIPGLGCSLCTSSPR